MSDVSSGEGGAASGDSGASGSLASSSSATGRRRRAVAFSYSRVREMKSSASNSRVSSREPGERTSVESGRETTAVSSNGVLPTRACGSDEASASSGSGGEGRGRMQYQFVETVPRDFCCRICGELMDDPLQTQCCKTDYCQPCLQPSSPSPSSSSPPNGERTTRLRWRIPKPSGITCPDCKSPNAKVKLNEDLKKRVLALQVKCPYASSGCVWEGEKAWLTEHLERDGGCGFVQVVCSSCGVEIKKKEEWNHATVECRMRMSRCQYCRLEDTYQAISDHYGNCPQYPVSCPLDCGETLPRQQIEEHTRHGCSVLNRQCPFRRFGCSQPQVEESELQDHVASCGELHLGDMARRVVADIDRLEREVKSLRSENDSLKQVVERATVAIETANEALLRVESRSETLCQALLCELEVCIQAREPHQIVAMECLKTQLSSDYIHLQAGGYLATIRMTSYLHHKETGQVWLSPAFYVYSGYKLRIAVHLNGVGEGKGTHVSIFLHQMAGERDSDLHWPHLLKDRVRVSLVDQTQPPTTSSHPPRSPRFFRRHTNLSSSPTSPLTLSLPPNASPLREPRRQADEQRSALASNGRRISLCMVESQAMAVTSYLQRVKPEEAWLGGHFLAKMELFCTQARVQEVVFCDSLIFTISLCSGNLSDGDIAC